jgi:TolA-binding protein
VKNKLDALENTTKTVSADKAAEAEALYEKGLQCYLAGDLDGAITAWQDALKADPDHTKAQNNLVRAKMERQSKTP